MFRIAKGLKWQKITDGLRYCQVEESQIKRKREGQLKEENNHVLKYNKIIEYIHHDLNCFYQTKITRNPINTA